MPYVYLLVLDKHMIVVQEETARLAAITAELSQANNQSK